MSEHIGERLDEFEIEQILKSRGLGVLGFAQSGKAYTIPIAFAYDDAGDRCILRFIMGDESEKRTFVSETEVASLTTYDWNGKDDWTSVVVRGPLRKVPDEDLAQAAGLFSDIGEEAALEVFNEPISEYDTRWYELRAEEVTGRGRFE